MAAIRVPDLTPQQRRQRTLEALVAQIAALARTSPVLMIFEDAHWSDPTSLEFLGFAIDRLARLRVLLIVTFRPEFAAPWAGRSHVTALAIDRLAQGDVDAMIDRVAGAKTLPADVRRGYPGARRRHSAFCRGDHEGRAGGGSRRRGAAGRRRAAVAGLRRTGNPPCVLDGATRPAWSCQGGGADRGGDRPRILPCPACIGRRQAGGGARRRARPVSCPPVCCFARERRRR